MTPTPIAPKGQFIVVLVFPTTNRSDERLPDPFSEHEAAIAAVRAAIRDNAEAVVGHIYNDAGEAAASFHSPGYRPFWTPQRKTATYKRWR